MIPIKTKEEIAIMAEGGGILARIMKELEKKASPGIKTKDLEELAEALVLNSGAKCSFLGHDGFLSCLCVSINEEIVHGLPSGRILKQGDIVSLDLGIFYKDFHTDMAITLGVGKISPLAKKLIKTAKKSLTIGMKKIRPGNTLGDIGFVIQKYVESQWFNVVRELCGHGIGRELHEEPQILNYGEKGKGPKIKEGMVFCVEPMITAGDWKLKKSKDGFGYETIDGSFSAHFEHTIAVIKNGAQILTKI